MAKDKPTGACIICGKTKDKGMFYKNSNSSSAIDYHPLCKPCIKNLVYDNSTGNIDVNGVKEVLKLMSLPFVESIYLSALKDEKETFGIYIKNLVVNKTYQNECQFKVINDIQDSNKNTQNNQSTKNETEENDNKLIYSADWRGSYTKSDFDYLEDYYKALDRDFKIVTKNHKDYARKIAKASLAMDRAYDDMLQGVSGADKRYKDLKDIFDTLSKSAQFSENARGANDVSLGCFGKVFELVEKRKWIPQHTPLEKDIYDRMIDDFSTINKSL